MELTDRLKDNRNPQRTWNIASSEHWYAGDDFWHELMARDPLYCKAMLGTEELLLNTLCERVKPDSYDSLVALGPGDGKKEQQLRAALNAPTYIPIDVNTTDLAIAQRTQGTVIPIHAEFRTGLAQVAYRPRKFVYLGNTYSNLAAMDYDLLDSIDQTLQSGESLYVSVQTMPNEQNIPLVLEQYRVASKLGVHARMGKSIGITTGQPFVQWNSLTQTVEIGAIAEQVTDAAQEAGVQQGDKLVTMVSHKPACLRTEVQAKFGERYKYELYQAQQPVATSSGTYSSTFAGAILTKQ